MFLQNSDNNTKRLAGLKTGEEAVIKYVFGQGAFRKRISEMGFVKGQKVTVIKNAPMKDPVEYEIMGYKVSLRRSEAEMIEVVAENEAAQILSGKFEGTIDQQRLKVSGGKKSKNISVALVGNPNSGKTTLFNYASGSKERVGNYAGVTIDAKEGRFRQNDFSFRISDLPGTYSITEYSPEELFVRNHIAERKPDVVVNVVDASNLERNLYLTTQLIDMNIKVVIALNMYDELQQKDVKFDYKRLGEMIGIPIVPTVASKGKGLKELFNKIIEVHEERDPIVRHIHINYGADIEQAISTIQTEIKKDETRNKNYSTRYLSIKLLEDDKNTQELLKSNTNYEDVLKVANDEIGRLERLLGDKSETLIADAKYGFIAGALKQTYKPGAQTRRENSREIDKILTHKFWGFPIFIFFIWATFQLTFTLGSYPMDWMDAGIGWLGETVGNLMPDGALKDLIVDGIIGGVGGVIIFLPNILILFFCISLMEDSGYMARAAFIMDKLMHKMGLHGKSFIPLIMGFGCNVPAVMATRTLDNKNDRLLTMLIIPFMSCSARLPVYVLLISAFFVAHQGAILFLIYFIGIALAVLVGLLFKKTLFAKKEVPFVMELPPYRMPTLKNTTIHMWHKGQQYLRKMGTVILFASIIIWAMGYYPRNVEYTQDYDQQIAQVENNTTLNEDLKSEQIGQLELSKEEERLEKSYIGQMGHFIEPVIQPLGFDWKLGMSIITGMAAKEIVVSSMGVLYHAGMEADETSQSLMEKLQSQTYTSGPKIGQKVFSPLVAFGLMIFVLIYFPCVAVVAAIKKEANWKWAIFTTVYTTAIAWIAAFGIYQIGSLFIG
ncbi:ferrous iron transport protein B [Mangrovibacterium diazotrophicum]|uniref:Ferrous iron transport protein B n=1 Tax=Mangrovibacterium diazotrophicum TaxID=1261403 RepID=A0A419W7Y4_9BACT|nr:ferrous iron transport protein B [Mangrovibacterium diazotrophicum]RKD91583.1 ferrous iron transport protein B [Mangrovibacterium diazotrophicum]